MNSLKIRKLEVLVIFVCLFAGLFCVYASAFKSREHAKQIVCASHVRLNCQSVIGYAADHDGEVTFNTSGWWPCDISFSATDDLMEYGSTRSSFYCPSNKSSNAFDARRWQFAVWTMLPNQSVYTDFDESLLTLSQKRQYFRVISYLFLTDNPSGTRPSFQGSPPRDWIRDLDDITNPQEYEMVVDQTISSSSMGSFYEITSGGAWNLFQTVDQTNHLNKSGMPLGSNIGFVDGHVAWRPFGQMQMRYSTGVFYSWW